MTPITTPELVLVRHAPAQTDGRLCGRRDVAVRKGGLASVGGIAAALRFCTQVATSPALRCRQTAEALFPGRVLHQDALLWEQDFGEWEGLDHTAIPDLGTLAPEALADHRPPGAGTEYGSGHAQATGGALRPADWADFAARIGFPEETAHD